VSQPPNPGTFVDAFKYIPPTAEMQPHFEAVARAIADAYGALMQHCPQSAERTLAVRDLQRARMWANAAISFEGRQIQT
jgi:hypothetical protein